MIELLVARHGQTDLNVKSGFQGHVNTALNSLGLAQANALGEMVRHLKVEAIYSSDLKRAYVTAAIATGKIVRTDNRLREQNFGVLDGLDGASSRNKYPAAYQLWRQSDAHTRLQGGESVIDVVHRIQSFLSELKQLTDVSRMLIVTHGGVLECMRAIALKKNYQRFSGTDHHHARISLFRLTDCGLELVTWNGVLPPNSRRVRQWKP